MCHTRAKYLLIVLFLVSGVHVFAQGENNPYSKYGIGELINANNTVLRGMGNISSAYQNPYAVNADNPASYSFLQRTTFEMGATAGTRSITGSGFTYRTGGATLSYMNIGLPIGKNAGMCFGFRPVARTYYRMEDTELASPIGEVRHRYDGDGALSNAFIGGSVKHKGFSIGFNIGYLFGSYRNTTVTIPFDSLTVNRAFNAEYTNYSHIGGVYWKAGLMYERKLDSSHTFRVGGTLSMDQRLRQRLSAYRISSYNLGDTLINDTTFNPGTQYGHLTMPLTFSVGAMISKNDKWSLGIDLSGTKWSGFKSTPDTALLYGVGNASYKLSLGGEYTPDMNNIRNYFSRVTYRIGAYYGKDYLDLQNPITLQTTQIPVYGVTLGGSLPIRRSISKLHVAMDLGRLGTTTNGMIQQTYFKFTLGFSFNDKWFIPRKYD